MDSMIYRIAPPEALAAASLEGVYRGEVFDQADGFIHASSRAQLAGTLAVHYADAERLGRRGDRGGGAGREPTLGSLARR
jgi:uncharacterized protein (DUF952 family)